jgi:hypothetical protein
MRHILEFSNFERSNLENDSLGWGEQIKASIKKKLVGKKFKDLILVGVEIKDPVSEYSHEDFGKGIIQLKFKKETQSELDQLMSDLSDVGLAPEKIQEITYNISAVINDRNEYNDGDNYDIYWKIFPTESNQSDSNFLKIGIDQVYDDSYDMSYGVGDQIAKLIEKQISK